MATLCALRSRTAFSAIVMYIWACITLAIVTYIVPRCALSAARTLKCFIETISNFRTRFDLSCFLVQKFVYSCYYVCCAGCLCAFCTVLSMNRLTGTASCLIRRNNTLYRIINSSPEVASLACVTLSWVCACCTLITKIDDAILANILIIDKP